MGGRRRQPPSLCGQRPYFSTRTKPILFFSKNISHLSKCRTPIGETKPTLLRFFFFFSPSVCGVSGGSFKMTWGALSLAPISSICVASKSSSRVSPLQYVTYYRKTIRGLPKFPLLISEQSHRPLSWPENRLLVLVQLHQHLHYGFQNLCCESFVGCLLFFFFFPPMVLARSWLMTIKGFSGIFFFFFL